MISIGGSIVLRLVKQDEDLCSIMLLDGALSSDKEDLSYIGNEKNVFLIDSDVTFDLSEG